MWRVTVPSTKNAKKRGTPNRIAPLFKEIRPYLEQAFEAAPQAAVDCVSKCRDTTQNRRTQLSQILKKTHVFSSGRNRSSICDPAEKLIRARSTRNRGWPNGWTTRHRLSESTTFKSPTPTVPKQSVKSSPKRVTQQRGDSAYQTVPPQHGATTTRCH